jgi:hypothetical protein
VEVRHRVVQVAEVVHGEAPFHQLPDGDHDDQLQNFNKNDLKYFNNCIEI